MKAFLSSRLSPLRRGIRPRTPLICLLVTAILAGMLTALTVAVGATPAHADAIDRTVLTWNMQGAGEGSNAPARKWEILTTLLSNPNAGRADVALLQEAGPMNVPSSAKRSGTLTPQVVNGAAEPINQVEHYTWKVSTSQTYHIYRIDWDGEGRRVNPAIVTREPADETILVGRTTPRLRPMLGVRFGNDVYFTLHASSRGGGDAETQAKRARDWAQQQGYSTMVGGDFNREPAQLGNINGMAPQKTGKPTHISGRELDYALAGTKTNAVRLAEPGRFSDHSPVLLIPDQACASESGIAARADDARTSASERCQDAVVSMGDSYISGEGGRWQGNGAAELSSRSSQGSAFGTDRAAFNCTGSGKDEVCDHDPKRVYGDTASGNEMCHRSDVAEIKSIGDILGIPAERRFNIACSGATTADVTDNTFKGEEPQVKQLAKIASQYNVKYVVLSIGGNDLGFSEIVSNCVLGYIGNKPCSTKGQADIAEKTLGIQGNVSHAIEKIKATLKEAGQENSKIILQGYPNPLPSADNNRYPTESHSWARETNGGCPVLDPDLDWLHDEVVPGMNRVLAQAAKEQKVIFLNPQYAFAGHELCSKSASQASDTNSLSNPPKAESSEWIRWIPGLLESLPYVQGDKQEAIHPNRFGQQALAACVAQTIVQTSAQPEGYFACYGSAGATADQVRVEQEQEQERKELDTCQQWEYMPYRDQVPLTPGTEEPDECRELRSREDLERRNRESPPAVQYVDMATGRCLDSNTDGDVYTLARHACNGSTNQWQARVNNTGGAELKNVATGLCLDSNTDGHVYTLGCNGGTNQRWQVRDTGGHAVEWKNTATGLCLESNADGSVSTKGCSQGDNQRWGP